MPPPVDHLVDFPLTSCPGCHAMRGRFLPNLSHLAAFDYYRCDQCGHRWLRLKTHPDAIVRAHGVHVDQSAPQPRIERRRVPRD